MNTPAAQVRIATASRQHLIEVFWEFCAQLERLKESERLQQIKTGVSVDLVEATRATFNLTDDQVSMLFNASLSTLNRWRNAKKNLDQVASERLDRIAGVCLHAESVFASRANVSRWMSAENLSCGHCLPVMLCLTEIGAKQVRRVLYALEWGGVA
ncbi:DUF2384 domain-containing protein [Pseudomonas kielensis]|uniref:antitoxin Xre-like helix-turn-helix domain-containing protein n=1 Tax=Pseudomonas TaxID=286 RepID=UPI0014123664|nr:MULTISPECIES: antitoxin Xre-like helix-turn-helix domain-containing protein [Pseudomonas]NBB32521.1 DUF2384 domain-containing protein [Pseudomonas sp. BC115LW]WKL54910.1 DUF2384 domain-containing protein [Pseudomonas kielensis]